jgi:putative tryptophan/tyrosine transport system substrate-binding protein
MRSRNTYERLTALAAELARRPVNVIATGSASLAVLAAKTATTTIPIVFLMGGDPVKLGLVASLNRPGGNLTGITTLNTEITPKRVQVLRELVPTTTTMAVLVNPTNNPANVEVELRQAEVAARSPYREFVTAGGLMSYGGSVNELYRLIGVYTGRVLNGENPADLPVQQVTKVELVINLKAAKSLGLDVPATLLARADEVIE